MSAPEWTWDSHKCDVCGDLATHELWYGEELIRRYCAPCAGQAANERDNFWRDLEAAAAGAGELAPD